VLANALGQADDPRAVDAVLKLTQGPHASERDQNRVGCAVAALAQINTPSACKLVADLIKNPEIFTCLFPSKNFGSLHPAVLDATAAYLHDQDENRARIARWTLGSARDPRALDAMLAEANNRKDINARWSEDMGASRDPRGEELW